MNGWEMVGETVVGYGHHKTGQRNQDSIEYYAGDKDGSGGRKPPYIMAISDGHGGDKYFRSHVGSRLAVVSAVKVLRIFAREYGSIKDPCLMKHMMEQELGERILQSWKEKVQEDLDYNPFTREEFLALKAAEGLDSVRIVARDHFIAYGATLQAVMITEHCILYIALGDGDILCVGADGKTARAFDPEEKGMDTGETDSLINRNAEKRFQFEADRIVNQPALILLTTDGYENSYPNPEDFLKIGAGYLDMINGFGPDWREKTQDMLAPILSQVTRKGCGDDVTLGIMRRK